MARRIGLVAEHGNTGQGGTAAVRLILRRVEPRSVVKCAGLAYLCFWATALVAGTVLWNLARLVGVLASVQRLLAQLTSSPQFRLSGARVALAASVVLVVLALLAAVLTGVAVVVSNLAADVVGGVHVDVDDHAVASRPGTSRTGADGSRAPAAPPAPVRERRRSRPDA